MFRQQNMLNILKTLRKEEIEEGVALVKELGFKGKTGWIKWPKKFSKHASHEEACSLIDPVQNDDYLTFFLSQSSFLMPQTTLLLKLIHNLEPLSFGEANLRLVFPSPHLVAWWINSLLQTSASQFGLLSVWQKNLFGNAISIPSDIAPLRTKRRQSPQLPSAALDNFFPTRKCFQILHQLNTGHL